MKMMNKTLLTISFSFLGLINGLEAKMMHGNLMELSAQERNMAVVSAYAARGDMPGLKAALAESLDSGIGVQEMKEILVQIYAYCGFPRSLNALNTFMILMKERSTQGIKDASGKLPKPCPPGENLEVGTANQTQLCGAVVQGELFTFAPIIDTFLKTHLFGDIFSRDNLNWKTRELVTIAALAAMKGTEGQLISHLSIGKHNGLTDEQIDEILSIASTTGKEDVFPKGDPAPAHFTGQARVAMLVENKDYDLSSYNVTFAPGTRNNWHSHSVGQILFCTIGSGYYQERGQAARRLAPGDVVEIPPNTQHWHGAAPDQEFVHLGITPKMSSNQTTWGDPVTDEEYATATTGP